MNKQLFIAILIFLAFSKTYSQDTINKRYRVGIDVSCRITDKYFFSDQVFNTRRSSMIRKQCEDPYYSFNFGFKFLYLFTNKVFLETGLYFANYSYKRHIGERQFAYDRYIQSKEVNTIFNYYYINIPVVYRYNWNIKKFSIYSGIGIIPQVLIYNKITGDPDEDIVETKRFVLKETRYEPYNMSVTAKLGINYKLNTKLYVFFELEPNFMLRSFKYQKYGSYEYYYDPYDNIEGFKLHPPPPTYTKENLYSLEISVGFTM